MSMKVQIQNIRPAWKRPNLWPSIRSPTSMDAAFVMLRSLWDYGGNAGRLAGRRHQTLLACRPISSCLFSNNLEDRERQYGLRDEADGKGQRAEHRQPQRIDDEVRHAGPEVHRASISRPFRRIIEFSEDQDQRREDDEILDRVVMREHQAVSPLRMRLFAPHRIGPRTEQAADRDAVEDVGGPQQSRQNDRQGQPEQLRRHQSRCHRFPLPDLKTHSPRDHRLYTSGPPMLNVKSITLAGSGTSAKTPRWVSARTR